MHCKDVRSKSLSVVHGDTVALHPTDLDIAAGEFFSVLGPSGAGKSTLLRAVGGFLTPTLGRVMIGGVDVTDLPPDRRPTVAIFSDPALFPRMSVIDNVAFGLEARGVPRATRRARAAELLDRVGLPGIGERRPADLGAEERSGVALARALAVDPAVLLLDRWLSAVALDHRRGLRTALQAIRRATGTTILAIGDDHGAALAHSDRVAVMNAGRIEQVDTPDRLYGRPASAFVARFVGEQNVLAGRVTEPSGDRVAVETAIGRLVATARGRLAPGDAVEVMIRPERLLLDHDRADRGLAEAEADAEGWNRLRGDLVGRSVEGATIAYEVAVADVRLRMHRPNLGPRELLIASLHAVAFHADDALAFPLAGAGGDDG
jgi:spermidine/putrescine transport system ATP-binding protein